MPRRRSWPRWKPGVIPWPAGSPGGCGLLTRGSATAGERGGALAVDGKAVRGTRHASQDGQAVHLLAVADQQASAVLVQTSVDGKTSEITCFAPLLEPSTWPGA
jgi:hypothetical protein